MQEQLIEDQMLLVLGLFVMIGQHFVVNYFILGFDTTSTEISVIENILKLDINQ